MNKKAIVYLVGLVAFFGPFTQTIYTPMLPQIQEQYQTSEFVVNLTISVFVLGLALMQLVYGPLTDRMGRRKVLLPSVLVYIAASFGAALSSTIEGLVFFRAMQAVGIASGSVVATTVIGDLYEGKMRGRAMGTFQMLVTMGPVVGPVVGGFVGEAAGVNGVFWVLTVGGVLLWLTVYRLLPETKPETSGGNRFSVRDFATVLQDRVGSSIVMLGFVQYFTFYQFLVFLPVLLTSTYGLSAAENGLVFLPMSLFLVVGSNLGGRLQERVQTRKLLILTTSLNVLATVLFFLLAGVSLPVLIAVISVFGLCLGLSLPVQTTMLADAFAHNRATAIGVYNFVRFIGMAAGPIIGTVFHRMGHRMEFLFAAVLFTCVVLFAGRQFVRLRQAMQG